MPTIEEMRRQVAAQAATVVADNAAKERAAALNRFVGHAHTAYGALRQYDETVAPRLNELARHVKGFPKQFRLALDFHHGYHYVSGSKALDVVKTADGYRFMFAGDDPAKTAKQLGGERFEASWDTETGRMLAGYHGDEKGWRRQVAAHPYLVGEIVGLRASEKLYTTGSGSPTRFYPVKDMDLRVALEAVGIPATPQGVHALRTFLAERAPDAAPVTLASFKKTIASLTEARHVAERRAAEEKLYADYMKMVDRAYETANKGLAHVLPVLDAAAATIEGFPEVIDLSIASQLGYHYTPCRAEAKLIRVDGSYHVYLNGDEALLDPHLNSDAHYLGKLIRMQNGLPAFLQAEDPQGAFRRYSQESFLLGQVDSQAFMAKLARYNPYRMGGLRGLIHDGQSFWQPRFDYGQRAPDVIPADAGYAIVLREIGMEVTPITIKAIKGSLEQAADQNLTASRGRTMG